MERDDEVVDFDYAALQRPYTLQPWHPRVVREFTRTAIAALVVLPLGIAVVMTGHTVSTFKEAHEWIFDWAPILGTLIGAVIGFYFAIERDR